MPCKCIPIFTYLLLAVSAQGQVHSIAYFFSYETPTKQFAQTNSINKEFVYSYDLTKRKLNDSTLKAVIEFDSAGDIVRQTEFEDSGKISLTKTYQYYETGKVFCIASAFTYPKSGLSRQQFIYDSAGNEKSNYIFNEDTTFIVFQKKTYDERNRLIASYVKPGKEDLRLEKRYAYLNNGDLDSEEFYDVNGNFQYAYFYAYDKIANTKIVYKKEGEKKRIFSGMYSYDSANRCTRYSTKSEETYFYGAHYQHVHTEYPPRVDYYLYHPDGTLWEWKKTVNNTNRELIRYYYTKN